MHQKDRKGITIEYSYRKWGTHERVLNEDGKKRGVSMEKSKAGTKEKRRPDSLSLPNQNTILKNIKLHYFTRYGKHYNKIQLTKKNALKLSKNYKSSTLPRPRYTIKNLNDCGLKLL